MTNEEMIEWGRRVASGEVAVDMLPRDFTEQERNDVVALAMYAVRLARDRRSKARRAALRLFRSWLTAEQLADFRSRRSVLVKGSQGGLYRIFPDVGLTVRVERHGRRNFAVARYCYHDPEGVLPVPDVALAHLLLLSTDEAYFLAEANETPSRPLSWDGDYMRRMRGRAA